MKLIAVTTPDFWTEGFEAEARAIVSLLDEGGFWRIHLRKPASRPEDMEALISAIPRRLRGSLSLHDHFELAYKYGVGGVHLNRRNPVAPLGWDGLVSRSCHSLDELTRGEPNQADYRFLSPIFDSISKQGYKSAFDVDSLGGQLPPRIVALGGVTYDRLNILEDTGFYGAAMLSAAWPS